ncbi:MAG: hypothetical protein H5T61_12430 [Thermoflexales bacterium]|nr:hypothetical protein [Thermoflexales bacterium]
MTQSPTKRVSLLLVPAVLLLLAALACGPTVTVVVTATLPPEQPTATAEGAVPVTTAPPTAALPTESPPPEPTTAAGCTLGARWVADVTVPDNTAFAPGTPFVKTWRVRNSGTCAWEPGTRLVFISGEPMGGPAMVDVPALAPGAQTDVSVSLVAPSAPGTYRANYQFQAPDGTRFGAVIWAQIVVPAPATAPPPTEAPTATPAVSPSPTSIVIVTPIVPTIIIPMQADLTVQAVDLRPATPSAGSTFAIDIRIANNGLTNASNFNVRALRQARGAACPGPGLVLFDRRFSVNAGQTATFSENARIDDAGDYSICVILDHTGEIPETNENNNALQKDITIAGLPDLYPFYIGMNTWSPRVGQDVSASITLRNGGNAPVPDFTVRLLRQAPGTACPGPGLVLFDARASLDANGSQVFYQTFRFTEAGEFQLCAVLDHVNRVAESNEDNNAIRSDRNVVVSP